MLVGFNGSINDSDIRADVPKIACPTLVITTDESELASVAETREWQETIKNSELLVPRRDDSRRALRGGHAGFHRPARRRLRATLSRVSRQAGS